MMNSVPAALQTLVDPLGGVPRAVRDLRWVWPMVAVCLLTAFGGLGVAVRLDASRLVIPQMQMSGELGKATEREVEEAIEQAQRVAIVGSVAKGVFLVPLALLLMSVALKFAAWLLGKKALFVQCFTVAVLALMPVALFHAVAGLAALWQGPLSPKMAQVLVPTSLAALWPQSAPRLLRVYSAIDVVNVWASLLLGLGFAAATKWSPWRGAIFGLVLYVLFASAFLIGVPGLMEGAAASGLGGPNP